MEGAEKLNDIIKITYTRVSNKMNIKNSLMQIIKKRNRCENFELNKT